MFRSSCRFSRRIPDPATGAPHFALGMLMPLTVA